MKGLEIDYKSMIIEDMNQFSKNEDVLPIEQEMRRLMADSRRKSRKKWHGMPPNPGAFGQYLDKICGVPIETLVPIIGVMFETMCFMPPKLVEDIVKELNKNEYEYVNRCRTCHHFREDGCYLKGYKQAKQPRDFCSSHSSCTHGSDNQPAY